MVYRWRQAKGGYDFPKFYKIAPFFELRSIYRNRSFSGERINAWLLASSMGW
jgi:hypothetical protein